MKKNIIAITSIMLMFQWLILGSCREDSQYLSSYFETLPNNDSSYAKQFKTFWTFLDFSYPHWDYETSNGVDWDAIYAEYLPKFEELDKRDTKEVNLELKQLYSEIVSRLHDGHMIMKIWNRPYVLPIEIIPQDIRNEKSRSDYNVPEPTIEHLEYYDNQLHFSVGNDSVYWASFTDKIVYFHIGEPALVPLKELKEWRNYFTKVKDLEADNSLKGIIIDLRNFRGGSSTNFHYILGALQPVNPISGHHRVGCVRTKSGLGRYDYNPKIALMLPIDCDYQLNITDVPIIVLSNCHTCSLGEIVCYAVRKLKNGRVIGQRTWGGLSPLTTMDVTQKYCVLGDEYGRNGSLYISIPSSTFFTQEGEILEGRGVTPDIEMELDAEEYEITGRDTQLERALEYIRTGK